MRGDENGGVKKRRMKRQGVKKAGGRKAYTFLYVV